MLYKDRNMITGIVDVLCNTGWSPTSKTSLQMRQQFEMTFNDVGPERVIVLQRTMGNEMPDFVLQIDQARNGFLVQNITFSEDVGYRPRLVGNCGSFEDLLELIFIQHYRSLPSSEVFEISGRKIRKNSIIEACATNSGHVEIATNDGKMLRCSNSDKDGLNLQGIYISPL